jgi:predicted ABC-type ATPase
MIRISTPPNKHNHNMTTMKRIVIIAGPNGAGKTTFARDFLPNEAHCPDFINADLIAAGLSPFRPEAAAVRAGRLMLKEIAARVAAGDSFAFETTLSGLAYAQAIPKWQADGYHVKLMFLTLPNAEMAVMRVAARVAQGGHNIPEDVIRRRFDAGLRNFHGRYKSLADAWILYDNGGDEPVIIDAGVKL